MIVNFRSLIFILFLTITTGCKQELVGGMTLEEVFCEPKIVAFVEAVENEEFNQADSLFEQGIDINVIGNEGITPLLWLMAKERGSDFEAIEYLLKRGADPNYTVPNRDVSAMYFAAGGNRPAFLELLIKYGGDVDLVGKGDESMLMVAASRSRKENIDILLANGADITYQSRLNHTVATRSLHLADYKLLINLLEKRNFNTDLQGLASLVEGIIANKKNQHMKEKVIDILKERGAIFPASGRLKRYLKENSVTDNNIIKDMIYGRVKY